MPLDQLSKLYTDSAIHYIYACLFTFGLTPANPGVSLKKTSHWSRSFFFSISPRAAAAAVNSIVFFPVFTIHHLFRQQE
jgi:hypothetical protein